VKEDKEEKQPEVEKEETTQPVEKAEEAEEELEEILEKEEEKEEEEGKEATTVATKEELPAAEAAEEEAKPKAEKTEEEEEIVEERVYTIPLSKAWIMPANKRAPKAMRILKQFVTKHMKLEAKRETEPEEEEEPAQLVVSNEVNERVWSKGIEKPPRNIRIRAAKDKEGNVTVYLAEGD
jgi:large subunit ribosomal protein L31e